MINFVAALPVEAKPLITYYLLQPVSSKPFHVYRNDDIRLVVSGIGKEKSKQAVSFLHDLFFPHPFPLPGGEGRGEGEAWINIGIAGHRDHEIGTGVLAHKITDSKSEKSWYPAFVFHPPVTTDSVLTVHSAESRYESPYVYDMEASGFYEAALRHSTAELVHCYKVISDNAKSSHRNVTPRLAEQMIGNRLNEIAILVTELQKIIKSLRSLAVRTEELEPFLTRWHFTVTQQFQLERLLRRLKTLALNHTLSDEIKSLSDAKSVLNVLKNKINEIPITFDHHAVGAGPLCPP